MADPNPNGNPNFTERVLLKFYLLKFNNRWFANDDLVDYTAVLPFSPERLVGGETWQRVKLHKLKLLSALSVLNYLQQCESLRELIIEHLDIVEGSRNTFRLPTLQALSISRVRVFGLTGRLIPFAGPALARIELNAPQLTTVRLGSNAIEHVSLTHPLAVVSLDFDRDLLGNNLARFQSLAEMHFNTPDVSKMVIVSFLNGDLGNLRTLCFNLNEFQSTAYRPTDDEMQRLQRRFNFLQLCENRVGAQIFVQNVQMHLRMAMNEYRFQKSLVAMHVHNYQRSVDVRPSRTVTETDFSEVIDLFAGLSGGQEPSGKFGFRLFAEFYPNIQKVVLNNNSTNQIQVSVEVFSRFLAHCRALTELEVTSSGFSQTFYQGLVQMSMLSTLRILVVFESWMFRQRIDFSFVFRFVHLEHLCTNLVTHHSMIDLVAQLPKVRLLLEFYFFDLARDARLYRCSFYRKHNHEYCTQVLSRDWYGTGAAWRTECMSMPLQQIRQYYEGANRYMTNHWLDRVTDPGVVLVQGLPPPVPPRPNPAVHRPADPVGVIDRPVLYEAPPQRQSLPPGPQICQRLPAPHAQLPSARPKDPAPLPPQSSRLALSSDPTSSSGRSSLGFLKKSKSPPSSQTRPLDFAPPIDRSARLAHHQAPPIPRIPSPPKRPASLSKPKAPSTKPKDLSAADQPAADQRARDAAPGERHDRRRDRSESPHPYERIFP